MHKECLLFLNITRCKTLKLFMIQIQLYYQSNYFKNLLSFNIDTCTISRKYKELYVALLYIDRK